MLKLVAIDYDETMEQSQYALDEQFPKNKKKLRDLTAFSDAPINSIYKNETKHSIGNKIAFNQFIQSIE
jgi:nucleoid-associated protein YejK